MNLCKTIPSPLEIRKDLNDKMFQKRVQKRENALLAFVMTATGRDNEQKILINKLQKELNRSLEAVRLLEIQNEVKDDLLQLKDKELQALKTENEDLQHTIKNRIKEKPVIQVEKVDVPSEFEIIPTSDSAVSTSNSPKESPKRTGFKRRLAKEANFIYNLRKRVKPKQ